MEVIMNDDDNIEINTNLGDLTNSRLNNIDTDMNTARIGTNVEDSPSLFAANNIHRKMADNLATAEALTDEKPLRTEMTAELERKEIEEDKED
jgi:hypothetical protein